MFRRAHSRAKGADLRMGLLRPSPEWGPSFAVSLLQGDSWGDGMQGARPARAFPAAFMDLLFALSPQSKALLNLVIRARFAILENAQYCRNHDIYGYVDHGRKFVICTRNIRSDHTDNSQAIDNTLRHEAVHVAHMCNGYRPFGIAIADMPLPPHKLADVRSSVRLSHAPARMEHEAHWLEDKPQKIRYVIQKYCF